MSGRREWTSMAMPWTVLMTGTASAPAAATRGAPAGPGQGSRQLAVFLDAIAGDVDDDGHAPRNPDGRHIPDQSLDADVLEPDGVQHAAGRLGRPRLKVAGARPQGGALADDGAQLLDIEDLRELT